MLLLNQKVDKVEGKGLSTHDFDDAARDLLHTLSDELNFKVDKVDGKGLSTCDFSLAYKNKLDGIENHAQENLIEEIRINNEPLTRTGKAVNITMADYLSDYYLKSETNALLNGKEDKSNKMIVIGGSSNNQEYPSAKAVVDYVKESLSSVYKYQGTKTVQELNLMEKDISMNGYVYNLADDGFLGIIDQQGIIISGETVKSGDNVVLVWDEDQNSFIWDKLYGTFAVDLSNYYTKSQSDTRYGRLLYSNTWNNTNTFKGSTFFGGNAFFNNSVSFNNTTTLYAGADVRDDINLLNGALINSENNKRFLMVSNELHDTFYEVPYLETNQDKTYVLVTTDDLLNYATLNDLTELDYIHNRIYFSSPSELLSNKDVVEFWANIEFKKGDLLTIPNDDYPDRYCIFASPNQQDLEDLSGEAWLLKLSLAFVYFDVFIKFECDGESWNDLYMDVSDESLYFYYVDGENPENERFVKVYDAGNGWVDEKYRKIIFVCAEPEEYSENIEDFLDWLPQNAEFKRAYKFAAIKAKSKGGSNVQVYNDLYIKEMHIKQDQSYYDEEIGGGVRLYRCAEKYVDQAGNLDPNEGELQVTRNDPRFAKLCIRTSYIDDYMIEKINEGRFVLRFDHPIRFHGGCYNDRITGRGHYSYARNFWNKNQDRFNPKWYDPLFYVSPSDIKEDEFGNKYISMKIPLGDLINKIFYVSNFIVGDSFRDNFFVLDEENGSLTNIKVGGATDFMIGSSGEAVGSGISGYYFDTGLASSGGLENIKNLNVIGQNRPMFGSPNVEDQLRHYWAPFVARHNPSINSDVHTFFSRRTGTVDSQYRKRFKYEKEACLKPRFCVIKGDFDEIENGSVWERKYKQYEKRMYIYPAQTMEGYFNVPTEENENEFEELSVVIFRFGISR